MFDCNQRSHCMCWRGVPSACVNEGVRLKCCRCGARFPFNSQDEVEHAAAELRAKTWPDSPVPSG